MRTTVILVMEKEHSRIAGMLEWLNHIRHSNVVVLLKIGEETEIVRFLRKQVANINSWTVELNNMVESGLSAE